MTYEQRNDNSQEGITVDKYSTFINTGEIISAS